jgi:hypothetical protein
MFLHRCAGIREMVEQSLTPTIFGTITRHRGGRTSRYDLKIQSATENTKTRENPSSTSNSNGWIIADRPPSYAQAQIDARAAITGYGQEGCKSSARPKKQHPDKVMLENDRR